MADRRNVQELEQVLNKQLSEEINSREQSNCLSSLTERNAILQRKILNQLWQLQMQQYQNNLELLLAAKKAAVS